MTIRVVPDKFWAECARTRNWPDGILPFSSWGCADDPHVVVYASTELDTYADPADPESAPLAACPRCHQTMPGYAQALAEWAAEFGRYVPDADAAALATAEKCGLYGHTSEGREWVYSTGHNGLVFTGRVADKARDVVYIP